MGAIIFLGVILSVGILCRYGIKAGGLLRLSSILAFAIVAFVYITVCLSTVCGAYSPIPEELFWKDAYPEKGKMVLSFSSFETAYKSLRFESNRCFSFQ